MQELLDIIKKLRSPVGCLWDRKQESKDLGRYLIEEAYEVLDAIEDGSPEKLREELGDLLFQILFLTCIHEEKGDFNLSDVVAEIAAKMIRRHPHVFGDKKAASVEEIKANWQEIKTTVEKRRFRYLDNIPLSLPSLQRAQRLTARASQVGFDWEKPADVAVKIEEELGELKAAIKTGIQDKISEEMGDLLFSLVNLCRFLDVDAEGALRGTIGKFTTRFNYIEDTLASRGKSLEEATLEEMDLLWEEAKDRKKVL